MPPDDETGHDLPAIQFGRMQSDVEHLKNQGEVVHRRIDKLDGKITNLDIKMDRNNSTVIEKLGEIQKKQVENVSFFKGSWRTLAVVAAIIMGIAGIAGGLISCVSNL